MIGTEKRKQAVAMKSRGYTYKQIGDALGIVPQYAQKLVAIPSAIQRKFEESRGSKCEICGEDDHHHARFHIHHKGPTDEPWKFNHFDNLMYLCVACHAQLHGVERLMKAR